MGSYAVSYADWNWLGLHPEAPIAACHSQLLQWWLWGFSCQRLLSTYHLSKQERNVVTLLRHCNYFCASSSFPICQKRGEEEGSQGSTGAFHLAVAQKRPLELEEHIPPPKEVSAVSS